MSNAELVKGFLEDIPEKTGKGESRIESLVILEIDGRVIRYNLEYTSGGNPDRKSLGLYVDGRLIMEIAVAFRQVSIIESVSVGVGCKEVEDYFVFKCWPGYFYVFTYTGRQVTWWKASELSVKGNAIPNLITQGLLTPTQLVGIDIRTTAEQFLKSVTGWIENPYSLSKANLPSFGPLLQYKKRGSE